MGVRRVGVGVGGVLAAAHGTEHLLHELGIPDEILGHASNGVGGGLLGGGGAG